MIRQCLKDAQCLGDERGGTSFSYIVIGLVIGMVALATAPMLGEGFDKSVQDKVGADRTPAPVGGSDATGGGSEVELDGASVGVGATTFGSIADVDFDQYGEAPDYEGGGGFPWKGVAIVAAAVVVTAVLIATAPVSIPMAIALGGATLIVASSTIELGECVFGDDACSDALIAPRAAFDTLSYPFLHPRETVDALATMGNNLVVQPIVQCTGLGSGSCGDALDTARDTGGQIVTGLRDAALTAGDCASTGDAASCGQTGAEIFAAFGIPAGANIARSRIATNLASRGVNPRITHVVAPRSAHTRVDTAHAEHTVADIARTTEAGMCNRTLGTCAPTAVENAVRLQNAGLDARVVEYHIPGSSSSHAVAQVTMPDGSIRHVSWGEVYGGLDEVAGTPDFNVNYLTDPETYRLMDRGPYGSAVRPDVQRIAGIHADLNRYGVGAATDFETLAANTVNMDDLAGPIYRTQTTLPPGTHGVNVRNGQFIDYDAHQILGTRPVPPAVQGLTTQQLDDIIADASNQYDAAVRNGTYDPTGIPAVRPVQLADGSTGGVSSHGLSIDGQTLSIAELQATRYPLGGRPDVSSPGSASPLASRPTVVTNGSTQTIRTSNGSNFEVIGTNGRELVIDGGSPDAARNAALELLGDVDNSTRAPMTGRVYADGNNPLYGETVGFTARTDGVYQEFRIDTDEVGPHYNVTVGKGSERQTFRINIDGTEADAINVAQRNTRDTALRSTL